MQSMYKLFGTLGIALACAVSPSAMANTTACPGNVVEVAQGNADLSTLVTAVKAAGLVDALATTPDLTVFAPTNEAFAKLPADTLKALLANPSALANVLKYHVVAARVPAAVAVTLTEATMLNGERVAIRFDGKDLFVNDAKVVITDVPASNGVIHVIDTVLIP